MKKYQKEIIKITAVEALKVLADFTAIFHGASSTYKIEFNKYLKRRRIEKNCFQNKIL